MSKVNILSSEVVSKIAAGEIIERPASVVKELVENAIDAAATQIDVTLKDAGKTLIHIKDNGAGIEEDDLEKIFLRHATSKISCSDDLFDIHSLGFRGEALYSIAAISDVLVQSKTKDQDSGWEIHMHGGTKVNCKPCSFANTGTSIEINELFFNTPARRKFLKSNTTEINQILNIFIPYTLMHHTIGFILKHQNKTLLDLAPTGSLCTRMASTLNQNEDFLLETSHILPEKNLSIKMILGDINITRSKRDLQFIFVNGRPVQNKSISFHMNQIYRLIMPSDVFPLFAVYIDLPPAEVDVNMHPTKREIKIKEEQAVYSVLRSVCEQALMTHGQPKHVPLTNIAANGSGARVIDRALSDIHTKETGCEHSSSESPYEKPYASLLKDSSQYTYPRSTHMQESFIPENLLFESKQTNLKERLHAARYIGTFLNKYHLLENEKILLIVDQHAAQERITYEKLLVQMEKGVIESQRLLTPILIKLTPQEWNCFEEMKEKLDVLGFECNQWDQETVAVQTYPVLIQKPERAIRELLSGENILQCDHDTIARRACRDSVMAGDKLSMEQVTYQIKELLQCLDPFTCPHGRPTVLEMNENFLNKQFLRT